VIKSSTPIFAVRDILATIAYYRDVFGFQQQWLWEDPPTFGCIELGKAQIFLSRDPDLAGRVEGVSHFLEADDVNTLHEIHRTNGAQIVEPLENKPWGIREYTVRDPNGYHLRFSGPEKYEKPADPVQAVPADVRIIASVPSIDQYVDLFKAVGWAVYREHMEEALTSTEIGVMAIASDGQPVGMARVTGDGMYYMIWDVIVRPEHQGRRIGATLLEAALREIRGRARPGAFVGLFTGKPGFYETLGFKSGGGMHRQV
jgi:uncharacterized glyoxalase superfamily protein PhnB/N-acetylglutamate synthase-like GNAT family acetyltransferase